MFETWEPRFIHSIVVLYPRFVSALTHTQHHNGHLKQCTQFGRCSFPRSHVGASPSHEVLLQARQASHSRWYYSPLSPFRSQPFHCSLGFPLRFRASTTNFSLISPLNNTSNTFHFFEFTNFFFFFLKTFEYYFSLLVIVNCSVLLVTVNVVLSVVLVTPPVSVLIGFLCVQKKCATLTFLLLFVMGSRLIQNVSLLFTFSCDYLLELSVFTFLGDRDLQSISYCLWLDNIRLV